MDGPRLYSAHKMHGINRLDQFAEGTNVQAVKGPAPVRAFG